MHPVFTQPAVTASGIVNMVILLTILVLQIYNTTKKKK